MGPRLVPQLDPSSTLLARSSAATPARVALDGTRIKNPTSANLIKSLGAENAFSSRRDNPIVAWHEVPGKRARKDPSRRVRYDRAQLIPEVFLVEGASRRTTPIEGARNAR
jgi:hypothetical protein